METHLLSTKFDGKYELRLRAIIRMASKDQIEKFIDKARELGCDEDEKAFKRKLKKIAKPQPKHKDSNDGKKSC